MPISRIAKAITVVTVLVVPLVAVRFVPRAAPHRPPSAAFDLRALDATPLDPRKVDALVLLGRVWGFAKYHHPRVTTGEIDWDASLRHAIRQVVAAPTAEAARDTIDAWLAAVGDPASCSPCAQPASDAHLQPDLAWLGDERALGRALSARLRRIHANRPTSSTQHYVRLAPQVGNPQFTNESAYPGDTLPEPSLRLLGVLRFWNMLEYWFPYRDLMERDRVALLREFVPAVWEAADVATYHRTMLRLVARAQDTHANLYTSLRYRPPTGTYELPVTVRSVEGRFVISGYVDDSLGAATGLRRGDVILRIDGMAVDSLREAWSPYYGASNDVVRRHQIARALTRGEQPAVRLAVERKGRRLDIAALRVRMALLPRGAGSTHDLPGEPFRMLGDGVAYLKLPAVPAADAAAYVRRAMDAKVLVIDIRNYPEFVLFAVVPHLVPEPTPFARFTKPDMANPGAFTWTEPVMMPATPPRFTGRVVILVDESTISRAEYTAMAFRAVPGAMVVGSTTAGADGNFSQIPLPGGLGAGISGIGVFHPDRRPTQQVGIVPDVEVRPTIAGIRDGRDEVLEAAVSKGLGRPFRLQSPKSP